MRKLASLQTVKYVRPIPGADAIEAIGVLGWQCVAKKGEFREGDPCVYFEIDSLLPEQPRYEFLRQSSFKPDLGRFKLRTVRLRKQLSQGLALPLGLFPEAAGLPIGSDLTAVLGIEQYEPPIPTFIAGDTRTLPLADPHNRRTAGAAGRRAGRLASRPAAMPRGRRAIARTPPAVFQPTISPAQSRRRNSATGRTRHGSYRASRPPR